MGVHCAGLRCAAGILFCTTGERRLMLLHQPSPPPDPHRPLTLGDIPVPLPVVADEPGEQAEMLVTLKNERALAELAGVDPEQLERIKQQERGE
jgi:hypothetical protein